MGAFISGSSSGGGGSAYITTASILASGWSNGVYSAFSTTYPPAQYNIEIALNGASITDTQLEAWSAAKIVGYPTNNDLKALGTVPEVDIPVILRYSPTGGATGSVIPSVITYSNTPPVMDGTASAGTNETSARGDHVHPTDTSRQATITASGILKGDGSGGVTAAVSGTDYAAASHGTHVTFTTTKPVMDGTAAVGSATTVSRSDHKHPTDTTRAALASPTFTGTPQAPTASAGTNTTQIATTAFVQTAVSGVSVPVTSVNSKTGAVVLTASDVGAQAAGDYMVRGTDYVTAGKASGTTLGTGATAEGTGTTASGNYAHAEGSWAQATNTNAHAEGNITVASGTASHAEGYLSQANAANAHAEGNSTAASGENSHSEGLSTTASRKSQHVFGEWNVIDNTGADGTVRGTYVEIVGKGTSNSARSNARTLDWDGNEVLAGKLTVGAAPTNNMDVATKQYVDTKFTYGNSDLTEGVSPLAEGVFYAYYV